MKPTLQLKSTQQLAMTPQLQQAIRLLQLSSVELLNEVQQQLDNNPLLEQDESPTELANESLTAAVSRGAPPADDSLSVQQETPETLADHLLWQLELSELSPSQQLIGYCLIEALDERGYLDCALDDILSAYDNLAPENATGITPSDVMAVLTTLQSFEPTGVAARNLPECLRIQLYALADTTPARDAALALLDKLGDACDLGALAKLDQECPETQAVLALLRQLDPAPGESFGDTDDDYILPDVSISKHNGKWRVQVNPQLQPKLSINQMYAQLAKDSADSDTKQYLRTHLQEARWFIRSLQSRGETLRLVAESIVVLQQDFFDYGEEAMRPLVLADVANRIGMHESTISRVTTRKYMHTPRGLFELKYFFSSHVGTKDGGECSSTAIRAIIKKFINQEPPQKPLSDNRLAQLLNDQGVNVARRTVAKYREAMNIPSSSKRKRLL